MARLSEMVNFFQACRDLNEALGWPSHNGNRCSGLSGTLFLMKASHNLLEKAVTWASRSTWNHATCLTNAGRCAVASRTRPAAAMAWHPVAICPRLETIGIFAYQCRRMVKCWGRSVFTPRRGLMAAATMAIDGKATGKRSMPRSPRASPSPFPICACRETLRHQAIRDQLTGLYNRRYLLETLERVA